MQDIKARFLAKIKVNPESGCHEWQAYTDRDGYGCFWIKPTNHRAHRVAYELFVGLIPGDLVIDHLCRNRACVNPAHLEPKTDHENLFAPGSESAAKVNLEKTACIRGHRLDEPNLRVNQLRLGKRCCRACHHARDLASRRPGADFQALSDACYREIMATVAVAA